ncbi:MAG: hypothetical protein V4492_00590 [Chlamydiota bacterium]
MAASSSSVQSGISVPLDRPITVGHGEYVVYHQSPTGEKTAPSRATFDAALSVLNHLNSPAVDHRYEMVRSKIQAIDPTLEITFVPRTYYEMQFLKKGIKEDLARKDFCPNERKPPSSYASQPTEECWHTAFFRLEEDNNAEAVKSLAHRLNQNLVQKLIKHHPLESTFNFEAISHLTEKQIAFFRQFHDSFDLQQKRAQGEFLSPIFSEGTPIEKFSNDHLPFSMGIRNEEDAALIRRAITAECHPIAEKAYLLSRGTDFPTDLPYSPYDLDAPYSFSFGPSLFGGAMFTGRATSFVYMKSSRDAYMMAVRAHGKERELFDIPQKHPICHLSTAYDVLFHPRSKVWRTAGVVWGFGDSCRVRKAVEPYFSPLDRETLTDRILSLKHTNVIFLKSADHPVMALPPAFQPAVHIHAAASCGKSLFIRGSDGGLTWKKGKPLVQIDNDHWIYRFSSPFAEVEYKILIDDLIWEEGTHRASSGEDSVEAPHFNVPLKLSYTSVGKRTWTSMSIRYNAGWGNTLSIVGNGPRMSWDTPTPLRLAGDDLWIAETTKHFDEFEYKLLLNGKPESGPNRRMRAGSKEEVYPRF